MKQKTINTGSKRSEVKHTLFLSLAVMLLIHTPKINAALTAQRDAGVAANLFSNFEAAHVHPLDVTPDGKWLLATNTANGTLEMFDASGSQVTLVAAIKVGVDPVSVRAISNTEAWVVNVTSDSVSIVDLTNRLVKNTLQTDDEPADAVFAGQPKRAYVSSGGAEKLQVFDPINPGTPLANIPILGEQPRALATSPDGKKVYLGIFESGNGTIALTGKNDGCCEANVVNDPSGPYGGVNPPGNMPDGKSFNPAMNPANPAPSNTLGMIVRRTQNGDWLDDNNRSWKKFVTGPTPARPRTPNWDLIDRDVAIIDTATQSVSYQGGMLNIVMALGVNPVTGKITAVGTDATNQVRYEPILKGKFLKVLAGSFTPGQDNTVSDLNPHLDYSVSTINPSARLNSIGDPRGIAWNQAGSKAYITGMGSNNLLSITPQGTRKVIPVGQGPTGVVLQEAKGRAFVFNKFDATISILNLSSEAVTGTVNLSYDPTPAAIRAGRPLIYNTQLTSGLGQASCASCHVDGKTDRIAWDLGDPAGAMVTSAGVQHHPMKGPLLTMTLFDTMQSPFLHWRGDKPDIGHFAGAFQSLQGFDRPATATEMATMKAFLETLRTPPNPYRNLDNSYSTNLQLRGPGGTILRTGNAAAGSQEFENGCRGCHPGNTGRGGFVIQTEFSGGNFLGPPRWQNFYRRDGLWFDDPTASTHGFGFQQDGTFDSTHNHTRTDNMMAFMYSFNGSFPYTPRGLNATNVSVDAHAAVGKQITLTAKKTDRTLSDSLISMANQGSIGVVANACVNNKLSGAVYAGNGRFNLDIPGISIALEDLYDKSVQGLPVTFTGVRKGTEQVIGVDEDNNGVLNGLDATFLPRTCVTPTLTPNYVVNGLFDSPSVAVGSWGYVQNPTGWVTSSDGAEVWRNLAGYQGPNGLNTWIETDVNSNGNVVDSVSQVLATPVGVNNVELKFWYSARPGQGPTNTRFQVLWNNQVIDTLAPDGRNITAPKWTIKRYTLTAVGNDKLTIREAGFNTGNGSLVTGISVIQHPNYVVNGTFNDPVIAAAGSWGFSNAMQGWWTSTGNGVEVWHNYLGYQGANGIATWMETDSDSSPDAVSQTLATPSGANLSLQFWYSARPGQGPANTRFQVLWNNTVIDTLAPDGTTLQLPQWQSKSYALTAKGNDVLTIREAGNNTGFGSLVTGVSIITQ